MSERKNNQSAWGPDNPHPLARMKTELVWEGKYDEYGNRRPVRLPESPLPLQRIERIDEPRDRSHAERLLWKEEAAHHGDPQPPRHTLTPTASTPLPVLDASSSRIGQDRPDPTPGPPRTAPGDVGATSTGL